MKFWKWIIGAFGLYSFGFFGAIIGFFFGSMIDSLSGGTSEKTRFFNKNSHLDPFTQCLLLLVATILKADGRVMQSELDFVKQFLLRNLGVEKTQASMLFLRDALKKNISLFNVCTSIRVRYSSAVNLQLMHLLFGIASADGDISAIELQTIKQIAGYLGITANDYESVKAMFFVQTDSNWAYKVLEIERSASNEEVKKAHRRMAKKYHPDKVAQMGDDMQKSANERFRKVQEAYEFIKKERNMY
ncbi:MAG: TerB family tellurite resistance protein [Bacteroidales bacterium]